MTSARVIRATNWRPSVCITTPAARSVAPSSSSTRSSWSIWSCRSSGRPALSRTGTRSHSTAAARIVPVEYSGAKDFQERRAGNRVAWGGASGGQRRVPRPNHGHAALQLRDHRDGPRTWDGAARARGRRRLVLHPRWRDDVLLRRGEGVGPAWHFPPGAARYVSRLQERSKRNGAYAQRPRTGRLRPAHRS